jgi:hypothetical protein
MSADDWLRAAKTEEQRLLGEIMKTDLYKRLDAVRTVIAVYQGAAESPAAAPTQPAATVVSTRANGPTSERSFKTANAFSEYAVQAATGGTARPD